MGIGFHTGQILWDFISQCETCMYEDASLAFKNATLPGAIWIRWGVEIVVFSMFVLSDAQM